MNYHTQAISRIITKQIIKQFEKRLKTQQLQKSIPQFLTNTAMRISSQYLYSEEMPIPNCEKKIMQDRDPDSISYDAIANGCVDLIPQIQGPVFCDLQVIDASQSFRETYLTKRIKRQHQNKQKSSDDIEKDNGVFALSQPILNQQQIQLEQDIDKIKKHLYFMRRLRKQNEEEQQKRLQFNKSNKKLQVPDQQFAFDFSGDFLIKQQSTLKEDSIIITRGRSTQISRNNIFKKKKVEQYDESNRDYLISRGGKDSRQAKRFLYGNMGKRQVSHLPFIKLSQNSKLSQNRRQALGQDTSRLTLKSFQSRGQSTFKHFAQIEKEKSNRLFSLKRSSMISQITQDEVNPIQITFSPKKQSKRMQKYLNKLCEDKNKKFVSEINKSCNFDRQNSPHNYSVHRYYRHDFNEDKRSICESSLASLKINTSIFRQIKLTQ